MHARYAFGVRFRLEPDASDATVDPGTFETRVTIEAADPGREGWLFFRDTLWRGAVNDRAHARRLLERKLGVPVETVTFRALETDRAYLDALKAEIRENLDPFNADDVPEVLSKYLGSGLEVEPDDAGE